MQTQSAHIYIYVPTYTYSPRTYTETDRQIEKKAATLGKVVDGKETLTIAGGDGNHSSDYGNHFLRKLEKIEMLDDIVIPLVEIYKRDGCPFMFIVTPFTITKLWKQPCCPSADECIRKTRQTQTDKYHIFCLTCKS